MRGILTKLESIPTISFKYLAVLAGLSFAICYAAVLASLVTLWSTHPLYSHGYAVPLIAGWLCWRKYRGSPSIERKPDYVMGVPLILAGVILLIIGNVGAVLTIQQTSLIVALAGFVLVFFGRETLTFYRFPFAYLLFMIPVWDVVLNHFQDPSRLISTKIASAFLHLANVPVHRQDAVLILPSVTLEVMRQCSGVNQLVAVTAMAVPAAYVFLDTNTRRLALIAVAVVVGYLSNGFRIALVGWFAVNGLGDGDLVGSYTHLLEGLVVSAAGWAVILVVLSCLSRFNGAPADASGDRLPAPHSSNWPRRSLLDLGVIAVLLIVTLMPMMGGPRDVGLARSLELLPQTLGSWRMASLDSASAKQFSGIREDLVGAYPTSEGVRRFAGVDDEISLVYENSSPVRLRLYVGYYRRQEEGRELTGDAGQVLATASTPVPLTIGSETVKAREVVRAADGVQRGIVYWYDINGRIVSDTYLAKAYTVWNGLTRQRTNGAVVIITWEDTAAAASPEGRAQAIAFARELVPVLRDYFNGQRDQLEVPRTRSLAAPSRQRVLAVPTLVFGLLHLAPKNTAALSRSR